MNSITIICLILGLITCALDAYSNNRSATDFLIDLSVKVLIIVASVAISVAVVSMLFL